MHAELKKDDASWQKKSSDRHWERSAYVDQNPDLLSGETTEGFNSSLSHALPTLGQGQLPMQFKGLAESPEPTKISGPLIQRRANNTGLPDKLKNGIENLSGYAMDDVKVHYNSSKPVQLQAHAYTQGTAIHVAPRQEQHLPHEAWHVVQQKQGRVKPTVQMKGMGAINDDGGSEREADVMGCRAASVQYRPAPHAISRFIGSATEGQAVLTQKTPSAASDTSAPIQRKVDFASLARRPAEEEGEPAVETPRLMEAFLRVWSLAKKLGIKSLYKFLNLDDTSLKFDVVEGGRGWRGETLLYCTDDQSKERNYDHHKEDVNELAERKRLTSFKVLIKINKDYVLDNGRGSNDVATGTLMQILAHEMLLHAEHMARYIQEYWDYYYGNRKEPPEKLSEAFEEHRLFANRLAMDYEKLLEEVKLREKLYDDPETPGDRLRLNIYRDFINSHSSDFGLHFVKELRRGGIISEEARLKLLEDEEDRV